MLPHITRVVLVYWLATHYNCEGDRAIYNSSVRNQGFDFIEKEKTRQSSDLLNVLDVRCMIQIQKCIQSWQVTIKYNFYCFTHVELYCMSSSLH